MQVHRTADVVVIGGGLTGIMSALRLSRGGASVIVVDSPLPQARGRIGGFARFSGAKFSLPPAGMGLLPVAGSRERLDNTITSVLQELGFNDCLTQESIDQDESHGLVLRRYKSIVLTPSEMDEKIDQLTAKLCKAANIIRGQVQKIENLNGKWVANYIEPNLSQESVMANTIFFGGGRLSGDLLLSAGAEPRDAKGIDLGIRLEFLQKESLSGLRELGPDAKILSGRCRTFCLNHPGHIYHYPFGEFGIPGGVVAFKEVVTANVGILVRVPNKREILAKILAAPSQIAKKLAEFGDIITYGNELIPRELEYIYGEDVCAELKLFLMQMNEAGLINMKAAHKVHMPLIDWHWNTFAIPKSHKTSLENVFALGDSSGHARGLLQAAMSGTMAAEEFLC